MNDTSYIIIIENSAAESIIFEKNQRCGIHRGNKITVNGGHATLFLEYLFLTKKISLLKFS